MTVRFGTIASILGALMVSGCSGLWGFDEFERYSQRVDQITMESGDAKEVNAITHMYHPWPPGVGERQFAADGRRMENALERYRRGVTPPDPLPDIGLGGTRLGERIAPQRGVGGGVSLQPGAGGTGAGLGGGEGGGVPPASPAPGVTPAPVQLPQ
jgi:hypothetical protein